MNNRKTKREVIFPYLDTQGFKNDYKQLFDRTFATGMNVYRLYALRRIIERTTFTQAWLKHLRINVVGNDGPVPTFSKVTGVDRDRLLEYWNEWIEDPTVEGGYSWSDLMAKMLRSFVTDGRTFGVFKYHEDYTHGIALQHIPREFLYNWGVLNPLKKEYKEHKEGLEYRGTVYGDSGRVKGYRFYEYQDYLHSESLFLTHFHSKNSRGVYIPIEDVVDYKNSVMSRDPDCVPEDMLAVASRIQQISNLDDSILVAMRVAANKMAFIKKTEEADVNITPKDGDDEYIPPIECEPNVIEELPKGYDVVSWDPTAPNQQIDAFRKELHKNASACLGTDYATVIGDLEKVNYSSIRHGAITSREYYRLMQNVMTKHICVKTLSRVLDWGIFTNKLKLRSNKSLELAKKTSWRHRAWGWIDPLKDAMASAHLLRMGITSPQALATGIGADIDAVTDEIAEFVEMMEQKGISIETLMGISGLGTSSSTIIEGEDSNEEDKDEDEGEGKEEDSEEEEAETEQEE